MGDVFGDDRWLARASYVLETHREDVVVGGDVLQGNTDTRGTLSVEDGESMLRGREGLTLRTDGGDEYRIIVVYCPRGNGTDDGHP